MKSKLLGLLLVAIILGTGFYIGSLTLKQSPVAETIVSDQGAQVASALPGGLVAYLPFDGSSLADASGNGNNAVMSGTTNFDAGKIGSGSLVVSNPNYAYINSKVYSTTAGTVAFWFKKNANGINLTGSYGGSDYERAPTLSVSPAGTLKWEFGGATVNDTGIAIDSNWHHVAMTYTNTGTVRVYLDGSRVVNTTTGAPADFFDQVHIGHYGNYGSSFSNASIDEFRIYNRALSASEISTLYAFKGAPVDTTGPEISNVTVSEINTTEVLVTWNTNEPADTYVEFGVSTNYGNSSALKDTGSGMVTAHRQSLVSLQPNTAYNYRVTSKDANGNSSVSGNSTFTTKPLPDTAAPSVPSGLSSSNITKTSATLSWNASTDNVGVTGYKVYRNGSEVGSVNATTYSDSGLTEATSYSYAVSAIDAAGNISAKSAALTVKTESPVLTGIFSNGSRIQTYNSNSPINVRQTPDGTILGTQAMGNLGTVIGGPQLVNGLMWWQVNYDTGADGWSVENFLKAYTAPNLPSSTKYKAGDRVQTLNLTNVRSSVGILSTNLLGQQPVNALGTVVSGGTQTTDGVFWWNVNYDSGVDGFSGEDNLKSYVPANVPPTVSVTAQPTSATAPATISLSATASDTDGTVSSVAFYNGATLLGTDSSAPYSYSWTGVAAGTYSVTARATDNSGSTVTSSAVSVTVSVPGSNKFSIGQQVSANQVVNVRSTAAGTLLGTQAVGTTGTVTGGPQWAVLNGTNFSWWNINFTSGADGWVGEDGLDAYTAPTTFTVSTAKAGTGSGTVSCNPTSCSANVGSAVSLTATPASGSVFAGWSGACSGTGSCSLTSAGTVTATFNTAPVTGGQTINVTPTTWANTTFVRGNTYILAPGSYAGKTFSTAVDGTKFITIKGSGSGQVLFTSGFTFTTSYWEFDGVIGSMSTNPGDYGFKFADGIGNPLVVGNTVGTSFTDFKFNHFAAKAPATDMEKLFFQSGFQIASVNNVTIGDSLIDGYQNGMMSRGQGSGTNSNWIFERNMALNGYSSSANHGEWINANSKSLTNPIIRYNLFQGQSGSAGQTAVIVGNNNSINGAQIYGNVFNSVSVGNGIISGTSAGTMNNAQVYNNTFANSVIATGFALAGPGTGNVASNNLFYNNKDDVNRVITSSSITSNYSASNNVVVTTNPFISSTNFRLSAGISGGKTLASPYNVDADGKVRGSDGTWDVGAYEYSGTNQPPTTFTVSTAKAGTGSGTVSCNPTSCSANVGSAVSLTATPASGSVFAGWSGACSGTGSCSLTSAGTVTATFNTAPVTGGTTFYVTPTGAGTKDGSSWSNAYAGLPATLVAGGTYNLGGGTYPKMTVSSSGTASAPITIVRPTSEGSITIGVPTIISGNNVTLDGGSWHGITFIANSVSTTPGLTSTQGASVILAGENNVLRNTFISGTYGAGQGHSLGISLPGTGTTRVEYNDFYQSAYEDMMTIVPRAVGGDIVFDHNVFRDNNKPNRNDTSHRDIVNTWTDAGGYGLVISNNIIFNTPGHASDQPQGDGFLLQDAYGGSAAALKKVEAFNNVVYNTARFIAFGSKNSGTNSFKVYNNTVRGAINGDELGITSASPAPSPAKSNNIGNSTANPAFINASSPLGADGIPFTADDGFNITSGSSAINAGTGSTYSSTDIRGNSRNGAVDLGAYEYTGTVTTPTNQSPAVTLISSPASAVTPATFTLTASASDSDGTIAKVDFYNGSTLISTDTTSPYTATFSQSTVGSYSLTARATDNAGASTVSNIVTAAVTAAPIPNSTKFSVNDRVTTTDVLNVRATGSTAGTLVGTQPLAALGTIIGGGTSADGYYWWNINYDTGVDGWSVENYLVSYIPPVSTFTVATAKNGTGSGTVSCNPSSCSANAGTTILVSATAASGSSLSGVTVSPTSAGSCTINSCALTAAGTVTATFTADPVTGSGGNWYLNANVSASGNGTSWSNAWKNTNNIVWSSIQPGDTLWVAGGSYGSLAVGKSGTAGKLIYIKRVVSSDSVPTSAAGWSSSLDSRATFGPLSAPVSYVYIDGRVDMGMRFISANGGGTPSSYDATNGHFVTVDHVDLVGPSAANSLDGASIGNALATFNGDNSGVNIGYGYPSHSTNDITVRNSRVRGHPNEFWFANAKNVLIENNKIYDNGAANSATWHGNLMIVNGSNGIVFRNNDVFNWQVEGLYPWGSASKNWYVYGNVFHDGYGGKSGSTHRFLELRSYSGTVTHGPFYVYNNTVANAYAAFTRGDTTVYWSADSVARNNLVYNVAGGGVGYLPANASNNLYYTTSPFVSATDYRLKAGIAGVSVPNVTTVLGPSTNFEIDPTGKTRGADGVWDVGAYEF